ncbi:hypothetical protein JQ604_12745 [Bradyrhizobium jicamae]|uniref:imm11 family protein n=1 Tax=Bradyrhizobium jicamae TaxID=280332 RepID=UPI001BA4A81C|nr:DUF1629 domain-containing protein [Bradyrhizobium jicamae]MBR0753054.1 hypothetical protein [Bradyrhizobium jicamae]
MVHLFEPTPRAWKRGAGASGDLLRKQIEGSPLQQSNIPAETALDSHFKLSDINSAGDGFRFVSDRGRAALEELAPGCVAFFPLNLKIPERIRAAAAYFFFDVLPRAQLIDWDQSPTGLRIVRAPDGRESRALTGGAFLGSAVKFKPTNEETPPIWREADLDRPTVHFFSNKKHIFLRDDIWQGLNARFPKQLVARKLG